MNFGKWLKDRRVELNMSQREFAEKTKIHQVSISALESGKRNPNFKTIDKIAEFLNISPIDVQRVISRKE